MEGNMNTNGATAELPVGVLGPARELTRGLGIHGWSNLDPILLAALATESPLLLVGPHGTAKTLLVERVAGALGLELRHYNASLVNYDDLVGIPIPDEAGNLRFVGTEAAIWDAEFVFFDELTRCRPDLQNKLFPIVHERRVAGIKLEKLQHRWSAMNPPAPEDAEAVDGDVYLGAEPLDPALADRFPFVVPVPTWRNLKPDERRRVVAGDDELDAPELRALIAECRHTLASLSLGVREIFVNWAVALVDALADAGIHVSPRRARMLVECALGVYAARRVLHRVPRDGEPPDGLERSAEIALRHGLPHTASEAPPSVAVVVAAHRQAWQLTWLQPDDARRRILEERDRVRRVKLGIDLGVDESELAQLVTQALEATEGEASRVGIATAMFLALRDEHSLRPSAWGTLADLASRALTPREQTLQVAPGPNLEAWREISSHLSTLGGSRRDRLVRGFLLGGFPALFDAEQWEGATERFEKALDLFEVAT
jgi:MoxR-like ATPase